MHTRFTGPHAAALAGVSAALIAAVLGAGVAGADSQQDQFVALLAQQQIPATDNVPGLVYRAHEICGELDHGASFDAAVDEEVNTAYADNPSLRIVGDRVRRTAVKFITASVQVYCPAHQGQLP
ncbi:hypothetical protein A5714_11215 [Mycobacterium sp. E2462]|uniref:DUF732 domain-containing protein n=1 Tax=unclassified Mycobacterium TaxID=2642494 RepID=UPI000801335D|nr:MULTISPECIES: DUF732 domain-containing protein [unclassified Mycobacterium]OBG78767.1 hypothetical protein A5700_15680 [Mycobacterium sp. E1214]OBH23722.1 hypothetical protein A5693_10035 [Mycobacterium sp. E1319]OBI16389.1 hypothetical protein A5714_11215 [Mycobacterium sp. E2462]